MRKGGIQGDFPVSGLVQDSWVAGWKSRCVGGKPAQQVTSHDGSARPSRRDCPTSSQTGAMDLGTFSKQTLNWLHSFSYPLGQSILGI